MKVFLVGVKGFEWTINQAIASNRERAEALWNQARLKLLAKACESLERSKRDYGRKCPACVVRAELVVEALSLESPKEFEAFVRNKGLRLLDAPFVQEFELDELKKER